MGAVLLVFVMKARKGICLQVRMPVNKNQEFFLIYNQVIATLNPFLVGKKKYVTRKLLLINAAH